MKKSLPKNYLVIALTLALSACTQSNDDLYTYIEETKNKHLGSVEPLPTFEPYKNFVYSAADMRDPFEAAFEAEVDETQASSLRPNMNRPKEPLETYPLDTLRMVGILEQNEDMWGLVKDPNNVVHRVQVGNYAGQNEGQIISVSESQIDIIEIIPDGLGGYVERTASLAIGSQ